jgi:hypothetical protein
VLWIRDILVRMDPDPRIRTNDVGMRILLFSSMTLKMQKKNFHKFFCLLLFEGTLKRHKKSQNRRNQGFSYYFCLLKDGPASVQLMADRDPGDPKTYGSDPQH